jgi:hypothetical protein
MKKKSSRTHKECLNKLFWLKSFTANTLDAMCTKCSIMTRAKCPIEIFKVLKSEIFGNFGPLIDYGTYWINLIILSFISENNRYSRDL